MLIYVKAPGITQEKENEDKIFKKEAETFY